MNQAALSSFIWSVANLLRGNYKPHEYGRFILPFTVLRRLDCVLAPTKDKMLAELKKKTDAGINPDPFLRRLVGEARFYNTSPMDLPRLLGDQDHIRPEHVDAWLNPSGDLAAMQAIFDDKRHPYYEHREAA